MKFDGNPNAHIAAEYLARDLAAAYWLHNHGQSGGHIMSAERHLRDLAAVLGFRLEMIDADATKEAA